MNRLHVHEITSIGAVEAGDNPEADILFWKTKETIEPVPGQESKGGSMEKNIESLDDALARISELETQLAAHVEEPAALPDDLPDAVVKALDEQAVTIAKMEAETVRVSKENEALRDERATEKYTKMAEDVAALVGPADETAPLFKAIGTAAPDEFEKLYERLAPLTNATAFEKLLGELGDSASDGGTAVEKIAAYADEIRKAKPDLSPAEAKAEAWREHPELKAQAREEGVR